MCLIRALCDQCFWCFARPSFAIHSQSMRFRLQPSIASVGTALVTAPGYFASTKAAASLALAAWTFSTLPASESTENTVKSAICQCAAG